MDEVPRIVGRCQTMCPMEEFKMREREGLLHQLELPQGKKSVGRGRGRGRGRARPRGDLTSAVKEYSRPAAGRADPDPCALRPPRILHQTISFLFTNIISQHHTQKCGWNEVYDFVFDRLRAIRQDMVIQDIKGHDAITILEACVSFHVYAAYRLCEHGLDTYDPVINSQHTQECLKRLLYLYSQTDTGQMDDADTRQSSDTRRRSVRHVSDQTGGRQADCSPADNRHTNIRHTDTDNSTSGLTHLEDGLRLCSLSDTESRNRHTDTTTDNPHPRQAEFESVYLLYNLGDTDALRHFLQRPKSLRCHQLCHIAYQISISYLLGNTLRVLRLAARLPSMLCLCALHRHLANIQSYGLKTLCSAYSSKNCSFPVSQLIQLLGWDTEAEAEGACQEQGLTVKDGRVGFLKANFTPVEKTRSVRWEFLESKLCCVSLPRLLLGDAWQETPLLTTVTSNAPTNNSDV